LTIKGGLSPNGELRPDGSFRVFPGGGIEAVGATLIIISSAIVGNSTGAEGGGIATYGGTAIINNSTIARNSASVFCGGGILVSSTSTTTIIPPSSITPVAASVPLAGRQL
jgi:hypothetical protein